ncbi:MAG: sulfite reductase alpha subunit-like flavoprotein [Cognaticolwellia sp.]|jgi:sulfite reductase alpha subunit-like flavoprotein
MGIILALIIALIIIAVVLGAIQQHKEKILQEKRTKAAKQKAIIDETEELLLNIANLPNNPHLVLILNNRCLNAAKSMAKILPDDKLLTKRIREMQVDVSTSTSNISHEVGEQIFILPDNEQQLVSALQCIKKLRVILKSEQTKGNVNTQTFAQEEHKLLAMQLKIGVETMHKRGVIAYQKEMLGSARQYLEKALQMISESPIQTEYCLKKREEIENVLDDITSSLNNTNAHDVAKKVKKEEDDLDLLFQPKKKW